MKNLMIYLLIACSMSFALSLEDVKRGVESGCFNSDSLEMKFKTTITSPVIGSQTTSTYSVRKGKNKIYYEIKSPILNQRTIVSGEKMRVIDLNTNKEIINSKGVDLNKIAQSPMVDPFKDGDWKEPVFVSENVYKIESDSSEVYYDASKKQIVKMTQTIPQGTMYTNIDYQGSSKAISSMEIVVVVNNQETKIKMVFSKFKNSKDFPESFFEF